MIKTFILTKRERQRMKDYMQTYTITKPEADAAPVFVQNCSNTTVPIQQDSSDHQVLQDAIQEEKNHSECYCLAYVFTSALSVS